jgi:hypothetical protein
VNLDQLVKLVTTSEATKVKKANKVDQVSVDDEDQWVKSAIVVPEVNKVRKENLEF